MTDDASMTDQAAGDSGSAGPTRIILFVVAVALAGGSVGLSTWWYVVAAHGQPFSSLRLMTALLIGAGGVASAVALGALDTALRLMEVRNQKLTSVEVLVEAGLTELQKAQAVIAGLDARLESLKQLPARFAEPAADYIPVARPVAESLPAIAADAIVPLLEELREIALMTETQKARRAESLWLARKQAAIEKVRQSLDLCDYATAQSDLDGLVATHPDDADLSALADLLQRQKAATFERDLQALQEEVRHYMSVGAWQQAAQRVGAMAQVYPGNAQVEELAVQIERERKLATREEFDRLFDDLKDASEHRQWRKAHYYAEQLLSRYPGHRKVEKLRGELHILQDNARLEERQEEESLFKDLLQRQRYEEAAAVARRVMQKYPDSPTARELERLLPKVRELIENERMRHGVNA